MLKPVLFHFYPRSPRGERLDGLRLAPTIRSDFYPRSPRGERQDRLCQYQQQKDISIHAPREGSDTLTAA